MSYFSKYVLLGSALFLAIGFSACSDQTTGEVPLETSEETLAEVKNNASEAEIVNELAIDNCAIMLVNKCSNPLSMTAAELRGRIGTVEGSSRFATPGTEKGFLSFGPYATLAAGSYNFTLKYNLDAPSGLQRNQMDSYSIVGYVDDERVIFKTGQLSAADTTLSVSVDFPKQTEKLEFRVLYNGLSTLSVDSINIEATR